MCRRLIPLAVAVLAPLAAMGEERPLSPEAFRAWAEGWTLHFEMEGRPFGAERYEEGGAVLWKPEGGPCAAGAWTPHDGGVCFVYADAISCWRLYDTPRGVEAAPMHDDGPRARVVRRDRAALDCDAVPAV